MKIHRPSIKATLMPDEQKLYHAVFSDETVTFFTQEEREQFLLLVPEGGVVRCESTLSDAEWQTLQAMCGVEYFLQRRATSRT